MQYCSASDLKNRLSEILDLAQREPVIVQKKGRNFVVILASVDYARYQEYQKNAFLDFKYNEINPNNAEHIEYGEYPKRSIVL